jgi:predicted transcriptional regulator
VAGESYVEAGLARVLGGVTERDVMSGDCPVVYGHENIQNFVDEKLLLIGDRCFVVRDGSGLAGLVTPHEAKTVDRARWPYTTVFDIMRPVKDLHKVQPETPLKSALEIMSRENLNQLPVVADGALRAC